MKVIYLLASVVAEFANAFVHTGVAYIRINPCFALLTFANAIVAHGCL